MVIVHVRLKYFMGIFSLESQLKKTSYQKYKPVWHTKRDSLWLYADWIRLKYGTMIWTMIVHYDTIVLRDTKIL